MILINIVKYILMREAWRLFKFIKVKYRAEKKYQEYKPMRGQYHILDLRK